VLAYSKLANDLPQPRPACVVLESSLAAFERIALVEPGRDKAKSGLDIAPDLPTQVDIDRAMVQQVLSNLIATAIRADDGRGVSVSLRRCSSAAPALRFGVCDHEGTYFSADSARNAKEILAMMSST
jgi:signal transduction histidine kinase